MIKKSLLILVAIISTLMINANTIVTNLTELNAAEDIAVPGDTIVLANGTWQDVSFRINEDGTAVNPIVITAQTAGSVFFEGNCSIELDGDYVIFEGVIFQNPSNLNTNDTRLIDIDADHVTIRNIKIDSFNGTEDQKYDVYKWIYPQGKYTEICYSSFIGKYGIGSIINHNRSNTAADYTKIHHNYFAGRRPVGVLNADNDQDAIRLGNSSSSLRSSYSQVYNNYFDDFQGEIEVISNKSCDNKYYNNTFRDYSGALTLRHGNRCEVYNNFFFGNDLPMASGVRIMGEDHKVYNNYIEGSNYKKPSGSGSNGTGGINVSNGVPNSALNEYYQVKNTTVTNNTFVNCDYGIRVGTKIKSTCTLAPENLVVANNIMINSAEKALEQVTAPIGESSIYEGNINLNGVWDLTEWKNINRTVTTDLVEEKYGIYRLTDESAAIDAGVGSYDFLLADIFYGERSDSYFDAGAEEYGAKGLMAPYTNDDIGVRIGFGALDQTYLRVSDTTLNFFADADTLLFNVLSNVKWTTSDDASWLTLSANGGENDSTIKAIVEENISGSERTAIITITEVGGSSMDTTIKITQSNVSAPVKAVEITSIHRNLQLASSANCDLTLLDYTGDVTLKDPADITISQTPVAGTILTGLENTITLVAENTTSGKKDSVQFNIAVGDETDPVITSIPATQNIAGDSKGIAALPDYRSQVVATDNCDNSLTISQTPSAGTETTSCTVTITVTDNFNNTATDNFDVNISTTPSSTKYNSSDIVSIYPNPSNGIINIKGLNINSIAVIDITGKVIMTDFVNDNTATIDLRDQAQGLYFMKISTEDGIYTKKIMLE